MPVYTNITVNPLSDNTLTIQLTPPTAIGAWDLEFAVRHRFGSPSGMILGYSSSGYSNFVSGISIVNSGQGILGVKIYQSQISGWDTGSYVYQINRTTSGFGSELAAGFFIFTW